LTRFIQNHPDNSHLAGPIKSNYTIELLKNDPENFKELVEIARVMSLNEVELR